MYRTFAEIAEDIPPMPKQKKDRFDLILAAWLAIAIGGMIGYGWGRSNGKDDGVRLGRELEDIAHGSPCRDFVSHYLEDPGFTCPHPKHVMSFAPEPLNHRALCTCPK